MQSNNIAQFNNITSTNSTEKAAAGSRDDTIEVEDRDGTTDMEHRDKIDTCKTAQY
jgi:hypothetical protein